MSTSPKTEVSDALASLTQAQMEDARLVSVVKAVGRPPMWNRALRNFGAEHKAWVVKFLASIPSPGLAAKLIGCSTANLYEHRAVDPDFRKAWKNAMANSFETLVGAAAEEALGIGEQYVMTRDGEMMAMPKERNDKLLAAFLLRESKVRHEHEHEHKGGVVLIPKPLSPEEFEKVAFAQQQRHRNQLPDSTARRLPVTFAGEPVKKVELDPDHLPIKLQSDNERNDAIARGEAKKLIRVTRA